MCTRYLGFVLLAWLLGLIHAQNDGLACSAPVLSGGYFVPEQQLYADGVTLTYACDSGRKPVVEGWWATIKCQDGEWSHTPQCIDENACLPPTIPNGKYTESPNGLYDDKQQIQVTCNDGYELVGHSSSTRCSKGSWSPVLVCDKRVNACSEPSKILHAVIINQRPQEVYPDNFELRYECEDGYSSTGANSITCNDGTWTTGPNCTAKCVIHELKQLKLYETSTITLKMGEMRYFQCIWEDFIRPLKCTNRGLLTSYNCCHNNDIQRGYCGPDRLRYKVLLSGSITSVS
ncbi:complement factor H-related protein 1-like isoform X1 [Kryptolebias marmoratus]|uniref:Coagulation factor XIII B chain-like n=1 Tax=Kryptolebias marmoratus TaxID=37003 RepID=A0A3Q2ZRD0_KRYMA|nr:complement factor H-related protein 1-like isoform X1 [Kryptolebias marmoratus]